MVACHTKHSLSVSPSTCTFIFALCHAFFATIFGGSLFFGCFLFVCQERMKKLAKYPSTGSWGVRSVMKGFLINRLQFKANFYFILNLKYFLGENCNLKN
jgi:hypothetical protein